MSQPLDSELIESCNVIDSWNVRDNFSIDDDELTFLTINVRSLRGKMTDLLSFLQLSKINFSFIALTEVALTIGA